MNKIIKRYKIRKGIEVVIEEVYSSKFDRNDFYVYGRQKIFFWWENITEKEKEYYEEDAISTAKQIKQKLLRLVK